MNLLQAPAIFRLVSSLKVSLYCLLTLFLLTACGGGGTSKIGTNSGQENTEIIPLDQQFSNAAPLPYDGPDPANEEIQRFKLEFWENLRAENRCGGCHGHAGQSPTFVRDDDVNEAYTITLGLINRDSPSSSRIVEKVLNGHNCWLASPGACADIITTYINNWLFGAGGSANQIELKAPTLREPGDSKNFPDSSAAFSNLHTLLQTYCADCHSDSSAIPISPYFASSDIDVAYEAAQSKMDLDTPALSRLVVRLRSEFHNCWSSNCSDDANTMQDAITAFSDSIETTALNPDLVNSKALSLPDGIVISGGGRNDSNVIAFYQFKSGKGNTIYDTSGVEPALNLSLSGTEGLDYQWVGGWGVNMINSKAQGLTGDSRKLYDAISSIGEYTIEAWIAPGNVTQEGPAVIIGYSGGTSARNFTLGQTLYNYNFLNRSSETDGNGEPYVSSRDDEERLQATLQHVVASFDPINGRQLYINGELIEVDTPDDTAGNLTDWDDSFAFVLGNETSSNRLWAGTFRMVAIHDRALNSTQIKQNYDADVGERFFLLFDISENINIAESYIVFEVSQFDNYSYLFSNPFYVSLDDNTQASGIALKGMRIGINGREASLGQAFAILDTTLDSSKKNSETGFQYLIEDSNFNTPQTATGTVIPLEKGPQSDEFFLTFERLDREIFVYVEGTVQAPPPSTEETFAPDIGIRTFDEINATLSSITGVSQQHNTVSTTFELIHQQLPTQETISSFLSSHQMAITQLSLAYCNAMVNDNSLRASMFGNFNFDANANNISDSDWVNGVINPLLNAALGSNISSQPDAALVRDEILTLLTKTTDERLLDNSDQTDGLPDGIAKCGVVCPTTQTKTATIAACATALGSAAMLLQ